MPEWLCATAIADPAFRRGAPLADGSATARHPTADVACVRPGPRTGRVVRWPVGPQGRRAGDSHVLMLFVP